jgi:hypothetical protein
VRRDSLAIKDKGSSQRWTDRRMQHERPTVSCMNAAMSGVCHPNLRRGLDQRRGLAFHHIPSEFPSRFTLRNCFKLCFEPQDRQGSLESKSTREVLWVRYLSNKGRGYEHRRAVSAIDTSEPTHYYQNPFKNRNPTDFWRVYLLFL